MARRKRYSVRLTDDDVSFLRSRLRKRSTSDTVANTARAFCDGGMDSVVTLKRSANSDNARRKVDGRAEAMIVATAYGPAPEGHSR